METFALVSWQWGSLAMPTLHGPQATLVSLIAISFLPRESFVHAEPYLWFDPDNPERFNCNTTTCALHDQWIQLPPDNGNEYVCSGAQGTALGDFGVEGPRQCKITSAEKIMWKDCKKNYCDMFENILLSIAPGGGDAYFGEEVCESFLHFNRTICEAHYRDAEAFCSCLCPTLELLQSTTDCEIEIMAFILLGHRSRALAEKNPVSPFCAISLCAWLERIGDPRQQGLPAHCYLLDLPFHSGQCLDLVGPARFGNYDPCPWDKPTDKDWIMQCSDGHVCDVRTETWACCQRHNNRLNCPRNFPVMCSDPLECTGDSDHCCAERVDLCTSKAARRCSPVTTTYLPEWHGLVTPAVAKTYVPPTTTVDIESLIVKPTDEPSSWGEKVSPYLPFILIPIGCCGLITLLIVLWKLAYGHVVLVGKRLIGAPRLLAAYKTDIVNIHRPKPVDEEDDLPLPPLPDYEAIERARADAAACEALDGAVVAAYRHGKCHLVLVGFSGGPGPLKEAAGLREAMSHVRARGLDLKGENPNLINRAEQWLRVLENERMLVATMDEVAPDLTKNFRQEDFERPHSGKPRLTLMNTIGKIGEAKARHDAWSHIEDLTEAIRTAKAGGASEGLLHEAGEMLSQLVANTPELPADRCVLDPDGNGVKLLPKGKNRVMWVHTGDRKSVV